MIRVGQNHIYMVNIRYFWQGNYQIYGHIRCIYMVLANPRYDRYYPLYSTFQTTVGLNHAVNSYKTVPSYGTIIQHNATVNWPIGLNFGPSFFLQGVFVNISQTHLYHASHCWALTLRRCSPNPASGSFREPLWHQRMRGAY
jgi:hypothetical protein